MLAYLSHGRRARIGDSVARHSCVYLCVKLKSLIRRVIIANRPSRVRVCSKVQGALKSVSWGLTSPPKITQKPPLAETPLIWTSHVGRWNKSSCNESRKFIAKWLRLMVGHNYCLCDPWIELNFNENGYIEWAENHKSFVCLSEEFSIT